VTGLFEVAGAGLAGAARIGRYGQPSRREGFPVPTEFRYPAFTLQQTPESKPLAMFAARATQIDEWVGVPQRRRLADEETVGWQREENEERLKELVAFFSDGRNVVQNPLLCALQDAGAVRFEAKGDEVDGRQFGDVVITGGDDDDLTLLDILRKVRDRLASRVASLAGAEVDQTKLKTALERAREHHNLDLADDEDPDADDDLDADPAALADAADDVADVASVIFAEETQLVDFHQEILIRIAILERLGEDDRPTELLGFTREAMASYLKPVVLVDGQHRLRGAVLAAKAKLESEEGQQAQMDAVDEGDEDGAATSLLEGYARQLPVSLLLDDSPSEHVFQFVVVNQKATPMGRALLGTIVSTSLSKEELEPVADRLKHAGIALDDSQAVAFMTRSPDSPFYGKVRTGVGGDDISHLDWNVLKGLTSIFRQLRGGKLYGDKLDYASLWRERYLPKSDFVAHCEDQAEMLKTWSASDGPWRDVFSRFYTLIRERFGEDDMQAPNAWGNTSSNLYNKVTLTILAADYFQFLKEQRRTLNSVADVDETVESWLEDTKASYFNRDWDMRNLKKDQKAVKETWAKVWLQHRKSGKLPPVSEYRPS
jgi:hypothetical protein